MPAAIGLSNLFFPPSCDLLSSGSTIAEAVRSLLPHKLFENDCPTRLESHSFVGVVVVSAVGVLLEFLPFLAHGSAGTREQSLFRGPWSRSLLRGRWVTRFKCCMLFSWVIWQHSQRLWNVGKAPRPREDEEVN